MTSPPKLLSLDSPEKDALIVALGRIETLVAEITVLRTVTELEAKLGLPPKTPNNSSTPPLQGRKASDDAASKPKGKPHAGSHRLLHPNPTARHDMMATACQHCGANVASAPQIGSARPTIAIHEIKPNITRVMLFGGTCPCCAYMFKAPHDTAAARAGARLALRAEPARISRLSALHARHLIRAAGEAFV
jgi:transposase